MADQSTYRTEAQRRYPKAILCGDGEWGVLMSDGRLHIDLLPTLEQAKKLAGGYFRIEYFGERPPVAARPFRHKMDREEDD